MTTRFSAMLGASLMFTAISAMAAAKIESGVPWYDTNGHLIQAHNGDITKSGDTYYFFGSNTRAPGCQFGCFNGINCYSSTDLQHWRFEGMVLAPADTGHLSKQRIAYDVHVLYNSSTAKYVMILSECCPSPSLHCDFATSNTITGSYTYQKSSSGANGSGTYDMMAFKDDDGSAYLIYSADNAYQAIDKLSSDYLSVSSRVYQFSNGCEEGSCMIKTGGRYYLYNSWCTGWNTNQGHYRSAANLAGPWSSMTDLGKNNTYNSQGTSFFAVTGTGTTTYIYAADRWNCPTSVCDLADSRYVWLPVIISNGTMTLNWYDVWYIDTHTGEWSTTPTSSKPYASAPFINNSFSRHVSSACFSL